MIKTCKLLDLSEVNRSAVLKANGLTEDGLNEGVKLIHEWAAKQPHLPKNLDPERTKRTLLGSKGSIEKSKNLIDMHYTMRTTLPEFFNDRDPKSPEIKRMLNTLAAIPLPRTLDNGRIVLSALTNSDVESFSAVHYYVVGFMIADIRTQCDFIKDNTILYDAKNLKIGHLPKITPSLLKKSTVLAQKGYAARFKQANIINAPPFLDSFIQMVKMFLSDKIGSRIKVHKNMESLYECIPREYLPSDYGGTLKSVKEMHAEWIDEINDWRDWFLDQQDVKSDESKRVGKSKADELFGTVGSFRKLNVD